MAKTMARSRWVRSAPSSASTSAGERIFGSVRGTRTSGTTRDRARPAGGWRAHGAPGSSAPRCPPGRPVGVEARHRRQPAGDRPGRQPRLAVAHPHHACDHLAGGPRTRRRRPPRPRPGPCRRRVKNVFRSKATARKRVRPDPPGHELQIAIDQRIAQEVAVLTGGDAVRTRQGKVVIPARSQLRVKSLGCTEDHTCIKR